MSKETDLMTPEKSENFFDTIVKNARNLLFIRKDFSPKKRDMILNWGSRKVKYLQIERKYKKIKDKRDAYNESKSKNEKDPQVTISEKITRKENTFMRKYEKEYQPKDIIKVDLGFNVGREYGGDHYAVVFKTSKQLNNTVYVIPLTSVKEGKGVYFTDYIIGAITDLNEFRSKDNEVESAAKLMSSMEVSKFRLLESGKVYGKLSDQQYLGLREAFFKLFLSEEYKSLKPQIEETYQPDEQ